MKKAFQFRIYPNKNQEVTLNRTLTTCRRLYNDSLAERKKQAELNRLRKDFDVFPWGKPEWIFYEDQATNLTADKDSFQKEVHSQVLQDVLKRVDKSFKNFYRGFGYPRFQGRDRYNSFTYPQSGFELKGGKIILSKIGTIKIIQHREIEGKIKTCTIKKDIDHWYVSFSCDIDIPIIPVEIKTKTGIDVGLIDLITLSDAGWYQLMQFTKSKAECAGKIVEFVNPAGTSQNCICGFSVPKDLSMRIHICPQCGLIMKRDQVSAILIENRP
ncbi:MAG: transposase, partial [Candidatus Methanoperedens sp.]|nr:transposase [Candidatus Methanoperedens sp.]